MNLHDTKKYIYITLKMETVQAANKITIDGAALLRLVIKYFMKWLGTTLHKPQKQKQKKEKEKERQRKKAKHVSI